MRTDGEFREAVRDQQQVNIVIRKNVGKIVDHEDKIEFKYGRGKDGKQS